MKKRRRKIFKKFFLSQNQKEKIQRQSMHGMFPDPFEDVRSEEKVS